jgi:hypothetical protein
MDNLLRIPLQRPERVLRHVEARLVSLGFHTAGVERDTILVRPDKLFCLCCGEPISLDQFTFCMGCGPCDTGRCHDHATEFFTNHQKLQLFLQEVRA